MYDVNVFVYGPEGEDLSFSRICNKEELNELLKCYDKNDLNVKEIPNARLSESMETCFCPSSKHLTQIADIYFVFLFYTNINWYLQKY